MICSLARTPSFIFSASRQTPSPLTQYRNRHRHANTSSAHFLSPSLPTALDDVKLICGQETEGQCICDDLYKFNEDGECVLDPDEVVTTPAPTAPVLTTEETIISSCNGAGGLLAAVYEAGCRDTDADRVCWEANTYK